MPHHDRPISRLACQRLFAPLVGLPVSLGWRGHGSAILLELGSLAMETDPQGRTGARGESTIMIEWSWRVEAARSIAFGSWSTDRRMDFAIPRLAGRVVAGIEVWGRLPELAVELSGGLRLVSFMTEAA
ncbi:MAG TPA: hypothetical protein VEX86_02505 [Longimicrobium sp.]|nr:hypothetical protein [Longimicrobium sp.]